MSPAEFTSRLVQHAAGVEAALWTLCVAVALDTVVRLGLELLRLRRKS